MAILQDEDATPFVVYCWINNRREVLCGYQKVGVSEKEREGSCVNVQYLSWIVVLFPLQIVPKDVKHGIAIVEVKNGELVYE